MVILLLLQIKKVGAKHAKQQKLILLFELLFPADHICFHILLIFCGNQ